MNELFSIRPMERRDAEAIARVHVRTWQAAYRGQLPDGFLDRLDTEIERRTARWEGFIDAAASRRQIQLVAEDVGRVIGFATFGPCEDKPVDATVGEIYAIYVDSDHWDRGYGRALFSEAERRLAAAGFREATLWVLRTNARARRFYEIAGWAADGAEKTERRGDVELHEVRYRRALGADDPKAIVRRGYDLVSRAYRADDAGEDEYGEWLDLLESRVRPPAKILDLGCGCGVPVARRLAPRYDVTGVDLSPVQIERARALVPTATFLCADMTASSFSDASFDAVVCLYAIIHVPLAEQPGFLRNVARWLRPGGQLIATVGHRAWTGTERDWLGVPGGDMWWDHADAATYRRWLADAGLVVEEERFVPEGTGGHTFVVASR